MSVQKTLGRTPAFTVGVIGSAGRRGDAAKMTKELYYQMLARLEAVVTNEFGLDLHKAHLVSGGAAWADHLAVMMFVDEKVAGLTLHLPAHWVHDLQNPRFHDDETKSNPGQMANKYHKQFTKKLGENSLEHISFAKLMGAKFIEHKGFKERNSAVARDSQYLVAFTWNDGDSPKVGSGTADTWNKHDRKKKKIHVPLSSLEQKSSSGGSSSVVGTASSSSQSQSESGDSLPLSESEIISSSSPMPGPLITGEDTKPTTEPEHNGPSTEPEHNEPSTEPEHNGPSTEPEHNGPSTESESDSSRTTTDGGCTVKKPGFSCETPDAKRQRT